MVAGYWWFRSAIDSWIEVPHIASTNVVHTIDIKAELSVPHIPSTNTFYTIELEAKVDIPHIAHTNTFHHIDLLAQGSGSSNSRKRSKKTAKKIKYTSPYLERMEVGHIKSSNKFHTISVTHVAEKILDNLIVLSPEQIHQANVAMMNHAKMMREEEEFLLSLLLEIA